MILEIRAKDSASNSLPSLRSMILSKGTDKLRKLSVNCTIANVKATVTFLLEKLQRLDALGSYR
jgi:hypothetical protein